MFVGDGFPAIYIAGFLVWYICPNNYGKHKRKDRRKPVPLLL